MQYQYFLFIDNLMFLRVGNSEWNRCLQRLFDNKNWRKFYDNIETSFPAEKLRNCYIGEIVAHMQLN